MSNIFKIKRGSGKPNTQILSEGELGYDLTNGLLYINDSEKVNSVAHCSFQYEATVETQVDGENSYQVIKILSTVFSDYSYVLIDLNSSDSEEIKKFRKADFIYYSFDEDNHVLTLKSNGKCPESTDTEPVTFDLYVTVVN